MIRKKDRSRFSIKFNEQDPMHERVICLLEQQPPHGKAQFLVNAVLHYVHCPETPDMTQIPVANVAAGIERSFIETIVAEILTEQGFVREEPKEEKESKERMAMKADLSEIRTEEFYTGESGQTENPVSDSVREMIANTMSAFRNG